MAVLVILGLLVTLAIPVYATLVFGTILWTIFVGGMEWYPDWEGIAFMAVAILAPLALWTAWWFIIGTNIHLSIHLGVS